MKENNVKEMTIEEIKKELGYDFKLVEEHQKVKLSELTPGDSFKDSTGREWILLEVSNKRAMCITKNFVLEDTIFDEKTNNFAKSSLYHILQKKSSLFFRFFNTSVFH